MTDLDRIRELLAPLNAQSITLSDQSARHAGHAGAASGGGHYELHVVSAVFSGKPSIARHREIYRLLAPLIPGKIHAISILAKAPSECGPAA